MGRVGWGVGLLTTIIKVIIAFYVHDYGHPKPSAMVQEGETVHGPFALRGCDFLLPPDLQRRQGGRVVEMP
jgi:hypothetical protein